jgi:hypothetical protein
MRIPTASIALLPVLVAACATSPRAVTSATPATTTTTTTSTTETRSTTLPAGGGAFVVRLGADTLAVERYTRTADRLEGDVVTRTPSVRVTHYVATLDADGRPTRIDYASRSATGALLPNVAKSVSVTFRGDSAWSEVMTAADTIARSRARVAPGTVTSIGNSYAMYETALMQIRRAGATSGAISLWAPGAPNANALKVTIAGNTATMDYAGDPVTITTDATGRIIAVDGTKSTNKVLVERLGTADIATIATAFAARPPMGVASPRDTARATVGTTQLFVDYGRPSVRGRSVWGGTLVPLDTVWRTGANAATQLVTSSDLVIGGTTVPAGKYTLWTLPSASGYQLIVNKQTGQWGTEYKPDQDLARIPLTVSPLSPPVEQFTVAIDPTADGGTLRMMWGDKQLSVPFAVKR